MADKVDDPYGGKSRGEWVEQVKRSRHPFYVLPQADQKIWRYMDLAKFVALLESSDLFFPRASLFDDPFEGSVSAATLRRRLLDRESSAANFGEAGERYLGNRTRMDQEASARLQWSRDWTYISCWHASEYESAAMWKLYAPAGSAIAIQTTFGALDACLEPHLTPPSGFPMLGLVRYADYETEAFPPHIIHASYFYKRKSFEHEREVRALIQDLPTTNHVPLPDGGYSFNWDLSLKPKPGVALKVDLTRLIDAVRVAGDAPTWFKELISRLCRRFGLSEEVQASALVAKPVY